MAILPQKITAGAIIEASDVSKSYKDTKALDNVSLAVESGRIFGLIGPDGAGKSTLIHILTGVLSAKDGRVTVLGKDVLKYPESIKTSIGFLPQGLGLALAQELSVEENINFFAEINHVDFKAREERKTRLLKSTQLDPFRDRPAKNLSGGMKQKLALCCTLIHEPELVFLDEPTTGVDPISRRDLWTLINDMVKEKNITVFLTTSYMDEASRCHEIVLMHKGRIIEKGKPSELASRLDGRFCEITVKGQQDALAILRKMPRIKIVYPMGDKLNCVYKDSDTKAIRQDAATAGLDLDAIEDATPGLEDIFLSKIAEKSEGVNEKAFEEFFKEGASAGHGAGPAGKETDIMIQAAALEKKFGQFTAVNKINFDVKRGEIFGFLGPNGAGKTTTIKMLCGLFPPTSGRGSIMGLDLFKNQFEIKKNIGYMSQKFSLYRDLTVAENIELYEGIYGVPRQEMARRRELIARIADLEGKESVISGGLPMGIKQRLALGCAIVHKPRCIFLDEPTSGVDPIARRKFWDVIFFLSRKMGVTVLVTTHYMDEAEYCDRVLLITRGNIVASGAPRQLKEAVNKEIGVLLEVAASDPFAAFAALKQQFEHCVIYGSNVHIYTKDETRDASRIRQTLASGNIEMKDMRRRVMPFEDVFVYFCEHAK